LCRPRFIDARPLALALAACTNNPYADTIPTPRFYLSYPIPPKTLSTRGGVPVYDQTVTGNVLATLLEYHYQRPYRLMPALAGRFRDPSPSPAGASPTASRCVGPSSTTTIASLRRRRPPHA
jgi:hypothetical protein